MKHNQIGRKLPSMAMEPPKVIEPPPMPALGNSPLSAKAMQVTPEDAAKWLTRNHPSNRPISWRVVEAYANDMRAGHWKLTHQAIAFDADGNLIDGQHRLKAVVHAGVVVPMLVIENAVGSFHDPIDRVRPRSIATILNVAHRETSCANILRMLEAGCELNVPTTLAETETVLERHQAQIEELAKVPGRTRLSGTVLAACVWAWPCDPKKTAVFAEQVAIGEMIGRGSPAFAFRNWQPRNRGAKQWARTMAVLNCLRFALTETSMATVHTTPTGYKAFCARRRALKIPNTPSVDLVPTGNWTPTRSEETAGGEP